MSIRTLFSKSLIVLAATLAWGGSVPTQRLVRYYGDRSVSLPVTVQRIACGWPAQNSIIAMLGYGNRIVATHEVIRSVPLFRRFVPSISSATPCFSESGIQMEELLKTRPEVVFLPGGTLGKYAVLQGMGIPVVALRDNSLQALVERTVITGEILGPDAHRRALAYQDYFNRNVATVNRVISTIPANKRIRVYHSMRDPLSTVASPSLVQDWMNASGAINVAAGWAKGSAAVTVSLEQVLRADPEVIIAMNADSARVMRTDPRWSSLRAVRKGRVYTNPKGLFWWCRETSEEALQILWTAKTLYPEHFKQLDMERETRSFYKTFYGYELTEQEVREILHPD